MNQVDCIISYFLTIFNITYMCPNFRYDESYRELVGTPRVAAGFQVKLEVAMVY